MSAAQSDSSVYPGWVATRRPDYWANGGLANASAADVASYRAAICMSLAHRRFVLIETDTAHVAEWSTSLMAPRIACIELTLGDGVAHPFPLERDVVQ
jgi:hypothetical protein